MTHERSIGAENSGHGQSGEGLGAEQGVAGRWSAVLVLMVVGTVLQVDNRVLSLLIRPIKQDFNLSDTSIGWLTGFAFSAVYLLFGVALARYVDRGSRRVIISLGLAAWGAAATLCGMAQNFVQLVLARMMLGAGESLNQPASLSLLSDLFPAARLPRAIAVMTIGNVLSSALSLLLSALVIGLVLHAPPIHFAGLVIRGWQLVFICVGLPGLLLAPLVLFALPEPPRRLLKTGDRPKKSLVTVLGHWWRNNDVYWPMFVGLGLSAVAGGGRAVWDAPFFDRTFGWSAVQYATTLGLVDLPVGLLGLFAGVWLAEALARHGREDACLLVVVLCRVIGIPALVLMPLAPTPWLAIAALATAHFTLMAGIPAQSAAIQLVTPGAMRGQMTALYLLMVMVVGTGLGPLVVGAMNDYVFHSEAALRWSLFWVHLVLTPLSTGIIALGLIPYRKAMQRANAASA